MARWKGQTTHGCESHYPDNGCKKARKLGYTGKCIDCPFPGCLEDTKSAAASARKARKYEMIRAVHKAGIGVEELAEQFRVSRRTIERAISG